MWIRHAVAIAVLPFVVTVLVPLLVALGFDVAPSLGDSPGEQLIQLAGLLFLLLGLAFFQRSLRQFDRAGEGTLAPWDPPKRLVVSGLYAYVRNPMITGVAMILLGESLALLSVPHLGWTVIFVGLNLITIPLLEEPGLHAQYGADYEEYCRHVPRVVPRLRPWKPDSE